MTTDDTRPDEEQQEPQEPSTRDASSDAIASARRSLERQSGTAWLINWCARVAVEAYQRGLLTPAQFAARDPENEAPPDGE